MNHQTVNLHSSDDVATSMNNDVDDTDAPLFPPPQQQSSSPLPSSSSSSTTPQKQVAGEDDFPVYNNAQQIFEALYSSPILFCGSNKFNQINDTLKQCKRGLETITSDQLKKMKCSSHYHYDKEQQQQQHLDLSMMITMNKGLSHNANDIDDGDDIDDVDEDLTSHQADNNNNEEEQEENVNNSNNNNMENDMEEEYDGHVYQIACGCYNTLFLTTSGEVFGQGKLRGQKQDTSSMEKIQIPSNEKIKEIVAVGDHSFLLTESGRVLTFGDSTWSQTGLGTDAGRSVFPPCYIDQKYFNYDPVVYISSGFGHSAFMTRENDVYTCGANNHSQLGLNPSLESIPYPTRIEPPEGVKQFIKVVCGCAFLYLITDDYRIFSCGSNNHGQCAQGTKDQVIPKLTQVVASGFADRKIVDVFCGQYYALFLEHDNTLWACGKNKYGLLGIDSDEQIIDVPHRVVYNGPPFKRVVAGYTHWLAVTQSNEIYGCGMSANGQLACDYAKGYRVPTRLDSALQTGRINYCAASYQHSVFYHSTREWDISMTRSKESFQHRIYSLSKQQSFCDVVIQFDHIL